MRNNSIHLRCFRSPRSSTGTWRRQRWPWIPGSITIEGRGENRAVWVECHGKLWESEHEEKNTCSPLSLLASAQVLIFIISNAKHSPLNKNHQVVVSAFPSTWNKKVETKKLSKSSKTTYLQPRCSIIFSGESQVPTSFQSTTSILGTQGSSNWVASNQLKGPFCWWCWGVQILRPGKRVSCYWVGEAIIKYPFLSLCLDGNDHGFHLFTRGIHGQFLSSCKRLPSRLLIERDIFGLILANPNKGHFWSLTGGEDSPCVWGPKCQGCHSFSWTHLLSRMKKLVL